MSVHGEQSHSGELREQSEFLQSELTRLSEQLKSQTDDAEKERLEMLIGDIHASIEIQKVTMEPTSVTSECAKLRQSSRERTLTPKMLELKQKEVSQLESKFNMQYTHWKDRVRDTHTKQMVLDREQYICVSPQPPKLRIVVFHQNHVCLTLGRPAALPDRRTDARARSSLCALL